MQSLSPVSCFPFSRASFLRWLLCVFSFSLFPLIPPLLCHPPLRLLVPGELFPLRTCASFRPLYFHPSLSDIWRSTRLVRLLAPCPLLLVMAALNTFTPFRPPLALPPRLRACLPAPFPLPQSSGFYLRDGFFPCSSELRTLFLVALSGCRFFPFLCSTASWI